MAPTRPSQFKSDIRIRPGKLRQKARPAQTRRCEAAGCTGPGECRVPRSPDNLTEHFWYCTAHARAHNESWDYFKGMEDIAIARFREEAILGHRPTWPMGKRAPKARTGQRLFREGAYEVDDGHALFAEDGEAHKPRRPERQLTRLQVLAMDTLQLPPNATLIEIKARYKELVKRFHPDTNGGDRGAEDRLKQVIKAYGVLRASGMLT
jgi:hypothetical protein